MMIKKITIKLICLVMLSSLPQMLCSQSNILESGELSDSDELLNSKSKEINLVFHKESQDNITSPVTVIDVEKELQRDQRANLGDLLNGKVPGVFGAYNTWGTGNSVVLVDGIPQGSFYLNSLSLLEIESVVILKDALSKAMYGAQGDAGIILVNTKRGKAGAHKLRVIGEYGGATPRAMPKYLNAADYMEKYNQAQINDGVGPSSLRYSQEAIDGTRSGENPARYPNNNFYSDDYIKEFTTGAEVFADVSGGDNNIRYYVNTGWNQSNGWLNTPQADITNNMNFRGNVDFDINEFMEMSLDATARLSLNKQPNTGSIWSTAANELPNNYPILWDPNLITDDYVRDFILSEANLVDGMVLGGNSSFLNNVYGGFIQNGLRKLMQRDVQFSGKLKLDLGFLTEGLTGSLYGGMNFFNSLYSRQDQDFAVYEPVFNFAGAIDTVITHGADVPSNKYHAISDNSDFHRQISYYGTLNYNRSIDEHKISLNGVIYNTLLTNNNQLQQDVLFHSGLSANYLYQGKYAAEASLMGIGSRKLEKGQRMELAPSIGLGWILSEEDYFSDNTFVDFLKVRTTFGISKNDNWSSYYLYKRTFSRGGNFYYQNGIKDNNETVFISTINDISLQKRRDFTLGFDASVLNRAMNVSFGYFNSASTGNITQMSNTYPQILGYDNLVYENYNSDRNQGLDLGVDYTFHVTDDFSITAGSNMLFVSPKITKRDEPFYEGVDAELMREGTPSDAMWGLMSDGLYTEADFNPDGTLIDGLPAPSFGTVFPGDIKYLDQNDDDVIDQLDNRIIGHSDRLQYSLYLDVRFKNLEFYVLGIGRAGDYNYRSGSYFRVYGNNKYSEMAMEAYGPDNKDPNALHPRLTTTDANNNNRNSDFWIYKNNSFVIPTMQLTYHFSGGSMVSFLDNSRVYVRANNMVITGKNKQYTEINPGGAPRTMGVALGLVTSF